MTTAPMVLISQDTASLLSLPLSIEWLQALARQSKKVAAHGRQLSVVQQHVLDSEL